jgi:carbon monoxide dehydrogenase subunit G
MDMQATRALGVNQQQAWDCLNDPEVLKGCIPGCDSVAPIGENQYAIGMSLRIGPVSAKFKGQITLTDIQAPQSYRILFEGQGGPAGFGKGHAQVQLTPTASGCDLAYTVQASVGGKVAQLGQRLIDGAARSLAEDFFRRFDEEMQRRYGASSAEAQAAGSPVAASASYAAAPGVMLPSLGLAGAGALAMLVLLWLAH